MPITYQFDPNRWVVYVRLAGPVSITDLRAGLIQMIDEGVFSKELRFLGDISGMVPKFTVSELIQYHDWREQMPRYGKMAIVASSDHEFGFARQFELATNAIGGSEMQVFRSMKRAREWLGLPDA